MNIEQIKEKFEKEYKGEKYLLFQPKNETKYLVVVFNGATRDRYSMWSFFYNQEHSWHDTAYLFLKDDQDESYFWWYLSKKDLFRDIIKDTSSSLGVSPKETVMIGSSMGGYAALLYGMELGVKGVISLRPQINFDSAKSFFTINKLKDIWVDLDILIDSIDEKNMPISYINYSEFPTDAIAAYHWIDKVKRKKTISIIHHNKGTEHVSWNPDKNFILNLINFMLSVENSWS